MSEPEFRQMLEGIKSVVSQPVETTILSVGGRGYYENPTSDLLAFFLQPDGEHRLGAHFIEAFLAAASLAHEGLALAPLRIEREARTEDNKRIDLLIRGTGWVMLVENKIWHHENNPFDSYDRFANRMLHEGRVFKVVLSPFGAEVPAGWTRVTYDFVIFFKHLTSLQQAATEALARDMGLVVLASQPSSNPGWESRNSIHARADAEQILARLIDHFMTLYAPGSAQGGGSTECGTALRKDEIE